MKRVTLVMMLLILMAGATAVMAQRDSDGDGVPDAEDNCPNVAGPRENNGCPEVTIVTPVPPDSDGDGIYDPDDQCPTVPGTAANGGCPEPTTPPSSTQPDDPNIAPNPTTVPVVTDVPPFVPPALPNDGCYITTNDDVGVNVREKPDLGANIIGLLNPGTIYAAEGYVMVNAQMWFVYITPAAEKGYVLSSVVNFTSLCPELPYEDAPETVSTCLITVGFDSSLWGVDPQMSDVVFAVFLFLQAPGTPIPAGTQADAVVLIENFISVADPANVFTVAPDPAFFAEIQEMHNNNEAYAGDYSWPTPNGAMYSSLGDDETTLYRLSNDTGPSACGPIVGEPIDDFTAASTGTTQLWEIPENCWWVPGNEAGLLSLQCRPEIGGEVAFVAEQREPALTPVLMELVATGPTASENTDTIEYCVYLEQEAGVFTEVCYEIEVPEGCVAYRQEAGVWKIDCSGQTVGTIDGIGLTGPTRDEPIPIQVHLQLVFGTPDTSSPNAPTPEYCVYEELEAGVFTEVCYPIEVPEGCWLETMEAGVWTVVCPPEQGGNMSFAIPTNSSRP